MYEYLYSTALADGEIDVKEEAKENPSCELQNGHTWCDDCLAKCGSRVYLLIVRKSLTSQS